MIYVIERDTDGKIKTYIDGDTKKFVHIINSSDLGDVEIKDSTHTTEPSRSNIMYNNSGEIIYYYDEVDRRHQFLDGDIYLNDIITGK